MGATGRGGNPDPANGVVMGLRELAASLREFFARRKQDQELEEELRFHLEMQADANSRAGMTEEEARRCAAVKLGGVQQIREVVRAQSPLFWLETVTRDAIYGMRSLRKSPGFAFIAIATLSLSIGACTALFSLLHGILLRPLPYPNPDQLVEIRDVNATLGRTEGGVSHRNVIDWRERTKSFDGIAAYYTMGRTMSSDNNSEVVLATQVSADFFRILRTPPLMGRTFTEAEADQAQYNNANGIISPDPLAVLSHSLWTTRFGGDPRLLGKSITLDRRQWKVVGIMPPEFAMPDGRTNLWIPWGIRKDHERDQRFAECIARLAEGVTLQQAESQLNIVAQDLAREFPETNTGWSSRLMPLHKALIGDVSRILWVLFAAVSLVLVIACANIAVLQLSRATARVQESYIRLALGAGRGRLVRQFFVESLLLAVAGGVLGIVLAYNGIHWLGGMEQGLPRLTEIAIDPTVLLASVALTAVSVLIFGLVPALVGVGDGRARLSGADGYRATVNAPTQRMRNALVVLEVALAVVLLSSSGMLIRSFARLHAVNPGFNPKNVLVLPIFLDMEKYGSGEKTRNYYAQLFEKLKALPDVVSVGGATFLPTSPLGPDFMRPVWDSRKAATEPDKRLADVRMITPDYLRTMGINVLRGRGFTAQDGPEAPLVVLVNEVLAQQEWPAGDAIGKKLTVDYSTAGTYSHEVVGIVNNVRFRGLRSEPRPEIYFPHAQKPYLILNVAIRTTKNPLLLTGTVRQVLHSIDPQKPAHNINALEDLVDATVIRDRYAMTLVSSFAFVAFTLSLLGIYGVLAFYVRQRVREIGIRIALGAKQKQIVQWITKQGMALLVTGLGIGLLAAIAFGRLLAGLLFETSPLDAISFCAAIIALSLTALAASWIPAYRASRIDPSIALRYE